jgi:hypothetical protein
MFSYLFAVSKKNTDVNPEQSPPMTLAQENEMLKAQVQSLLTEKAELEKAVKNLKIDSSLYLDLMFTKLCNCKSN